MHYINPKERCKKKYSGIKKKTQKQKTVYNKIQIPTSYKKQN